MLELVGMRDSKERDIDVTYEQFKIMLLDEENAGDEEESMSMGAPNEVPVLHTWACHVWT